MVCVPLICGCQSDLQFFVILSGTRPTNIKKIATHGLLPVGHPQNPSKAVDKGYFGAPTHGVYVSRYVDYVAKFSNDLVRVIITTV
jgi:hypothetical protein